jgi:hypothetical protein
MCSADPRMCSAAHALGRTVLAVRTCARPSRTCPFGAACNPAQGEQEFFCASPSAPLIALPPLGSVTNHPFALASLARSLRSRARSLRLRPRPVPPRTALQLLRLRGRSVHRHRRRPRGVRASDAQSRAERVRPKRPSAAEAGHIGVVGGRPPARKTLRTRPPELGRTCPRTPPRFRSATPTRSARTREGGHLRAAAASYLGPASLARFCSRFTRTKCSLVLASLAALRLPDPLPSCSLRSARFAPLRSLRSH